MRPDGASNTWAKFVPEPPARPVGASAGCPFFGQMRWSRRRCDRESGSRRCEVRLAKSSWRRRRSAGVARRGSSVPCTVVRRIRLESAARKSFGFGGRQTIIVASARAGCGRGGGWRCLIAYRPTPRRPPRRNPSPSLAMSCLESCVTRGPCWNVRGISAMIVPSIRDLRYKVRDSRAPGRSRNSPAAHFFFFVSVSKTESPSNHPSVVVEFPRYGPSNAGTAPLDWCAEVPVPGPRGMRPAQSTCPRRPAFAVSLNRPPLSRSSPRSPCFSRRTGAACARSGANALPCLRRVFPSRRIGSIGRSHYAKRATAAFAACFPRPANRFGLRPVLASCDPCKR